MRLFLDASVMLAAAGSPTGSSRALFSYADAQGWLLVTSPYALNEVLRNLGKMSAGATDEWLRLRPQVAVVDDVLTLDRPVIFPRARTAPFCSLRWRGRRFY